MAGDPITTGISLASMGFGLLGQSRAAGAQAGAQEYQANQMNLAAKFGQVQATQTDQFMRQGLASTLANISAVRSAAGTATDSPTGAAIAARVAGQSDTERQQREANIQAQVASDQGAAAFYNQSAQNTLAGGQMGMFGTLLGGLGGAFKSMNIGGGGFVMSGLGQGGIGSA